MVDSVYGLTCKPLRISVDVIEVHAISLTPNLQIWGSGVRNLFGRASYFNDLALTTASRLRVGVPLGFHSLGVAEALLRCALHGAGG